VGSRVEELETIAAALPEPARTTLRAALEAHRAGALEAAADRVRALVMSKLAPRWVGLLLALDAAELRMGGAVALGTPDRWEKGREKWGTFGVTVYPGAEVSAWSVVLPRSTSYGVTLKAPALSPALLEAAETLAQELARAMGGFVSVDQRRAA